jgi:hypothetical protein
MDIELKETRVLVPTAAQRILCCWFSGACETMRQVPKCTGRNKSIFSNQYSCLFLSSISLCNLLIDLPRKVRHAAML